ncbi:class I SAM-dependent methyltransferase [Methanomethylovorans sp.]|uniref:class I SAM-dependent methyltransferase n=1 Tax=Methanomethylovorans sp. TaxID=2758717 RepID=UPI00351C66AA
MDESAIFEIFDGLPRQGPGSNKCTEKAFNMLQSLPSGARILDIGCGVGMQTLHLASICEDCHITATDIYQPYLDKLMKKAAEKGLSGRISTVCASMDDLPFKDDEFDVIWCEGAIFVIGFEKGLNYWKRFLKEGGFIALTEAAWFTDTPSEEAQQLWQEAYPDIKDIPETEKGIEAAGYTVIDRFRLPASAWWDDYYVHFEKRLDSMEAKFKGNADAGLVIEFSRKEIEVFRKHSDEYGYVFFIMQK